jgi:hypothetical protein
MTLPLTLLNKVSGTRYHELSARDAQRHIRGGQPEDINLRKEGQSMRPALPVM